MKKHKNKTNTCGKSIIKSMEKVFFVYFSVDCIFSPHVPENLVLFQLIGIIFDIQKRKDMFENKTVYTLPCNCHKPTYFTILCFFQTKFKKKSSFLYLTGSIQGQNVCKSE
jgi:hypothetical protein